MTWIKKKLNTYLQYPIQMHIDPLHAPLSTTRTSPLFVINPQHQPFIKTIPTKNTLFATV